uniref:PH domain-containing protein n=1 Tax=Parastrongyloides trichosuri TaxID=131310 RepID=A0A0N4Z415_PARTI
MDTLNNALNLTLLAINSIIKNTQDSDLIMNIKKTVNGDTIVLPDRKAVNDPKNDTFTDNQKLFNFTLNNFTKASQNNNSESEEHLLTSRDFSASSVTTLLETSTIIQQVNDSNEDASTPNNNVVNVTLRHNSSLNDEETEDYKVTNFTSTNSSSFITYSDTIPKVVDFLLAVFNSFLDAKKSNNNFTFVNDTLEVNDEESTIAENQNNYEAVEDFFVEDEQEEEEEESTTEKFNSTTKVNNQTSTTSKVSNRTLSTSKSNSTKLTTKSFTNRTLKSTRSTSNRKNFTIKSTKASIRTTSKRLPNKPSVTKPNKLPSPSQNNPRNRIPRFTIEGRPKLPDIPSIPINQHVAGSAGTLAGVGGFLGTILGSLIGNGLSSSSSDQSSSSNTHLLTKSNSEGTFSKNNIPPITLKPQTTKPTIFASPKYTTMVRNESSNEIDQANNNSTTMGTLFTYQEKSTVAQSTTDKEIIKTQVNDLLNNSTSANQNTSKYDNEVFSSTLTTLLDFLLNNKRTVTSFRKNNYTEDVNLTSTVFIETSTNESYYIFQNTTASSRNSPPRIRTRRPEGQRNRTSSSQNKTISRTRRPTMWYATTWYPTTLPTTTFKAILAGRQNSSRRNTTLQ